MVTAAPFPLVSDLAAHLEQARHDRGHHYHPHGYVRSVQDSRGRCTWRWDSDGCTIVCWNYDVPGHGYCAHHLSQQPEIVTFPATVVDAGTLQIAGNAE